jgi:hypothetical protein
MKQWLYYTTLDAGLVTSPRLFGEIVKRFRVMVPVVEMLNAPLKSLAVGTASNCSRPALSIDETKRSRTMARNSRYGSFRLSRSAVGLR